MNENAQKQMDALLLQLAAENKTPRLLLHSCCAPCSSYVLEYLSSHFHITVYYYNPNIHPEQEYHRRAAEQKRLIGEMPLANPVVFSEGPYQPQQFYDIARGLETSPEGGERCFRCYRLRLEKAARAAKEGQFDYFTTTLSISPHKNAAKLNEIGRELSARYGIPYLCADFKKRDGFKRSIALSAAYGLYRQDYCGCIFSQRAAD